jgi:tetratricopeptide (TPR) repeat protein
MVVGIFRFIATRTGAEVYTDYEVSSARSGTWHYLEGEYDMAIAEFNIAIHSNPEFGDAYNGRGLVYLAMGRLDEALADFDRAIELLPESGDAYNNRGAAYYHEGDYTRAMADFDMAIQVEPGFAKAHYNRALVHNALGRYAEAIADFDRAIELTPETTFAALNEPPPGVSAAPIDELLDYFRLMESEADLPLAYANRGLAYLASGDFERAAADFSKALELGLDPDDQGWVEQGLEQVQSALSK